MAAAGALADRVGKRLSEGPGFRLLARPHGHHNSDPWEAANPPQSVGEVDAAADHRPARRGRPGVGSL
jgi:hypothetical protein